MLLRAILPAVFAGSMVLGVQAPASADSDEPGICNFMLSEPSVTQVSGVPMVTASLTPGGPAVATIDTTSPDTTWSVDAPPGNYWLRVAARKF